MTCISKINYSRIFTLFIGLIVFTIQVAQAVENIKVYDPIVMAMPKISNNAAIFLTLTNTGKQNEKLVSVDSNSAERIELHGYQKKGDMLRMLQVNYIDICAGKTVKLQNGDYHIMLIGLKNPMTIGDHVNFTLNFLSGTIDVQASVKNFPGVQQNTVHDSIIEN